MTEIIGSLDEIDPGYSALFCDLWGCLHDGVRAFPEAVAALERFRGAAAGRSCCSPTRRGRRATWRGSSTCSGRRAPAGTSSSPRATRRRRRWRPGSSGGGSTTSGRSATSASSATPRGGRSTSSGCRSRRRRGSSAPGSSTTAPRRRTDYRATILYGKTKGLKLLCANPDIVVDVGDRRIYCAGAIAQAYAEAGGRSYYFGKPHPPIYALARRELARARSATSCRRTRSSASATGSPPTSQGAMGEGLDSLFVTGGLAAEETGTGRRRARPGAARGLSRRGADGAEAGDGLSALGAGRACATSARRQAGGEVGASGGSL